VTSHPTDLGKLQSAMIEYCRTLTENRWDAEDLFQETWSKALGKAKLEGHANPQALLMRIAKTTWIDRCRKRKVAGAHERRERSAGEPPGRLSPNPAERLELEPVFQALINHLTPKQRAVFMLKDVFDFTIPETAEMLNMTEGAAKAALHRARGALENVRRELRDASREPEGLPGPGREAGGTDGMPRKPGGIENSNGAAAKEEDGRMPTVRRLADAYVDGDVKTVIRLIAGESRQPAKVATSRMHWRSGRVMMLRNMAA